MHQLLSRLCALSLAINLLPAAADVLTSAGFVNGIAISGGLQDLSTGNAVDRRVGFFSDIYYDPNR